MILTFRCFGPILIRRIRLYLARARCAAIALKAASRGLGWKRQAFWLPGNNSRHGLYQGSKGRITTPDEIDPASLYVGDRHPCGRMGVGVMVRSHDFNRVRFRWRLGGIAGNPKTGRLSMRKALAKRGQAYEQPLSLRLTPEALVYDLGDLTMTANWRCVTDLFQTRKYWVFLVQSSAMVLPRRFLQPPKPNTILLPRPCRG